MKIVTIVSPDKITQAMFADFYRVSNAGRQVITLEINSLFSHEVQLQAVSEATRYLEDQGSEGNSDILIKYRTKLKSNILINKDIEELSGTIIKFDMFSTHPEVLKEPEVDSLTSLFSDWEVHVERLNK